MSCSTATNCGDCLVNQWNLPTNAMNFTSGDFCQWCPETNSCTRVWDFNSTCSGSGQVNFATHVCPELVCALNRISTSPYICSRYGIVIFCLTLAMILLTGFTAFSWYKSSKAKNARCKMNSGARGDYKRCRECGETSQSANFMCKACDRHGNYFGLTITCAVSLVLGLYYTVVAPLFAAFIILLVGAGFTASVYILKLFRSSVSNEQERLLSTQYLIVEDDVEANEKFTFGLDGITTSQLRYSMAKEISRENQAVNFVLETTQHLDFVVLMSRFMFGFYIWIATGLLLLVILTGWNSVTQIMLPVALLLPVLGFAQPLKNRKQAIVITSKNIIIAQQASKKVRISSVKLADVKEIKVRKIEGQEQYGHLVIHKNDNSQQTIFRLSSVTEFEAALVHAQFEATKDERKLARNWFTKNCVTIILGFEAIFAAGMAIYMIVRSFQEHNWIFFWAGIGLLGTGAGSLMLTPAVRFANPFIQDLFTYRRRV